MSSSFFNLSRFFMDYDCLLELLYAILVANHICQTETIRILLITWNVLMEALYDTAIVVLCIYSIGCIIVSLVD